MGKIADAYVEISTKTDGFDKGLVQTEEKLKNLGGKGALMPNGAATAAGIAGIGLTGKLLIEAGKSAATFGETMNKVDVIFGPAAEKVKAYAQEMADKFGLVKNDTLQAAANIGQLGIAAGMTKTEAAALGVAMLEVAGDATSLNDIPLDIMLAKITSGLVGQVRPLREVGVLMSDDTVKAAGLTMELGSLTGKMTEQEKVLARVQIITKGLAYTHGDLAKTIDSTKNAVRRLNGEWENLKADTGGPASGLAADALKAARHGAGAVAENHAGARDEFGRIFNWILGLDERQAAIPKNGMKPVAAAMAEAQKKVQPENAEKINRDSVEQLKAIREGIDKLVAKKGGGAVVNGRED